MISPSKPLPPATFWGGPACGAEFESYGIDKFPKYVRIPHRGRLHAYTLHFKRRNGQTVYAYRYGGLVTGVIANLDIQKMERDFDE